MLKPSTFLAILLLASCASDLSDERYAHITDPKARAIIQSSIADAGGLDRWEAIKQLSYTKDYQLLLESGAVETDYRQTHHYEWLPLKIDIQSVENGAVIHTHLEGGQYSRTQQGQATDVSQEALARSVNSAVYVVSLPFKLLDPQARIEYLGPDSLNGELLEVLAVSYPPDTATTSTEIWKYYFAPTNKRIVANWVRSNDHYSLIENQSYVRVKGILFNQKRQSFRVDSLGRKLYLRADYWYDNYQFE